MYANVVFVIRCLYIAMNLTLVRKYPFNRIMVSVDKKQHKLNTAGEGEGEVKMGGSQEGEMDEDPVVSFCAK